MRKPPDVRLRFWIAHQQAAFMRIIQNKMDELQKQRAISEFFFSNYEPELDKFGGSKAMEAVHYYFTLDTLTWISLERLDKQGCRQITPANLLLMVFHDLFQRTLRDDVLVFCTWERLGSLINLPSELVIPEIEVLPLRELCDRPLENWANTYRFSSTAKERELLLGYLQANKNLARDLTALWKTKQLTADVIDILANIALFNFHRHGFVQHSPSFIEAMKQSLRKSTKNTAVAKNRSLEVE